MKMRSTISSSRPAGTDGEAVPWPETFAEQPVKAVAAAFSAGLLLNLLPIGKIAGMLTELAFTLARPLLLCLGLMKTFEYCRPGFTGGGKSEQPPPPLL